MKSSSARRYMVNANDGVIMEAASVFDGQKFKASAQELQSVDSDQFQGSPDPLTCEMTSCDSNTSDSATQKILEEAWQDESQFRFLEEIRRQTNSKLEKNTEHIFISHCWRNPSTQEKKRRIIDNMSKSAKNGGGELVYWADYLDLQAEGPVAWRKEIEDGIASCSKFVAMVDTAWLTSFNCLQELALACNHEKPLVIIILEQEAWSLLTVPGGAEKAKQEADADFSRNEQQSIEFGNAANSGAENAWCNESHGPALCCFEGEPIVPGKPMSIKTVAALFRQMSAVNMCPCRELEELNSGWDGILSTSLMYVKKDLAYNKEHTRLKHKAEAWAQASWCSTPQSLLEEEEANYWLKWITAADTHQQAPCPNQAMRDLIRASLEKCSRRKRVKHRLAVSLIVILLAGLFATSFGAALAVSHAKNAKIAQRLAEDARKQAEDAEGQANEQKRLAVAAQASEAQRAKEVIDGTKSSLALLTSNFILSNRTRFAAEPQFVALSKALERLPSPLTARANVTLLTAGRSLLQRRRVYSIQNIRGDFKSAVHSDDGKRLVFVGEGLFGHLTHDSGLGFYDLDSNGALIVAQEKHPIPLADICSFYQFSLAAGSLAIAYIPDRGLVVQKLMLSPSSHVQPDGPPQNLLTGQDVTAFRWSPDGRKLACSVFDLHNQQGMVFLWSVDLGSILTEESPTIVMKAPSLHADVLAWSPDGRILAAKGSHSLFIWNLIDNASFYKPQVVNFEIEEKCCGALAWSNQKINGNHYLAAGIDGGRIMLWEAGVAGLANPVYPQVLEGHSGMVKFLAWSPSNPFLASGSLDGTIRLWEVGGRGSDGNTIYTQIIHSTEYRSGTALDPQIAAVRWLSWAPNGRSLVFAVSTRLLVLTVGSGGEQNSVQVHQLLRSLATGDISDIQWSPNSSSLAVASMADDRTVRLLHVSADGFVNKSAGIRILQHSPTTASQRTRVFRLNTNSSVYSLAWASDGHSLATGSDGHVYIWQPDAGTQPSIWRTEESVWYRTRVSVAWAPMDKSLAALTGKFVYIWKDVENCTNSSNGDPKILENESEVYSMAWSPTGRELITGEASEAVIHVWSLNPQKLKQTIRLNEYYRRRRLLEMGTRLNGAIQKRKLSSKVKHVAYSPDGDKLAFTSGKAVHIFDWSCGQIQKRSHQALSRHDDLVWSFAWSPSGKSLASGSLDGTVSIWHRRQGGMFDTVDVQVLRGHDGGVSALSWSPNTQSLAVGTGNGGLHLHRLLSIDQMRLDVRKLGLAGLKTSSKAYEESLIGWLERSLDSQGEDSAAKHLFSVLEGIPVNEQPAAEMESSSVSTDISQDECEPIPAETFPEDFVDDSLYEGFPQDAFDSSTWIPRCNQSANLAEGFKLELVKIISEMPKLERERNSNTFHLLSSPNVTTDSSNTTSNDCALGCQEDWLGDGECDLLCNTTACEYDSGDCIKGQRALCDGSSFIASDGSDKKPHCDSSKSICAEHVNICRQLDQVPRFSLCKTSLNTCRGVSSFMKRRCSGTPATCKQSAALLWDEDYCASKLCNAAGCGWAVSFDNSSNDRNFSGVANTSHNNVVISQLSVTTQCSGSALAPAEVFDHNNTFDLSDTILSFNARGDWCGKPSQSSAFETPSTNNAIRLNLKDDEIEAIHLKSFSFPMAGRLFSVFCLSSNGYISMIRDSDLCREDMAAPNVTLESHFDHVSIAAYRADLDPSIGGTVQYWEEPGVRLSIQFLDVPMNRWQGNCNMTFRLDLEVDGRSRIVFGPDICANAKAVVGVSYGILPWHGYTGIDLSASRVCKSSKQGIDRHG